MEKSGEERKERLVSYEVLDTLPEDRKVVWAEFFNAIHFMYIFDVQRS
jgi:hypothetical protein